MALNGSGPISLGGSTAGQSVNLELGQQATATISFNDANVRTLTGTTAGTALSMPGGFWGKSTGTSLTISTNQKELNLRTWALANGWNGSAALTVTIPPSVYIWSDNVGVAGLTINGTWPNGVTVVNNGYIIAKGGKGGGTKNPAIEPSPWDVVIPAQAGGSGISLGVSCVIVNNGFICGGGGGGAMSGESAGGGGAGGGAGGDFSVYFLGASGGIAFGGAGGAINLSGANGASVYFDWDGVGENYGSGGGGGRIIFGSGGSGGVVNPSINYTLQQNGGYGGGTGGGGGGYYLPATPGKAFNGYSGGSGNLPGMQASTFFGYVGAGGGGGWGAKGGDSYIAFSSTIVSGAAGGKAIALNGYTATLSGTGTTYGAIS